jgi:hypothetical protein
LSSPIRIASPLFRLRTSILLSGESGRRVQSLFAQKRFDSSLRNGVRTSYSSF